MKIENELYIGHRADYKCPNLEELTITFCDHVHYFILFIFLLCGARSKRFYCKRILDKLCKKKKTKREKKEGKKKQEEEEEEAIGGMQAS